MDPAKPEERISKSLKGLYEAQQKASTPLQSYRTTIIDFGEDGQKKAQDRGNLIHAIYESIYTMSAKEVLEKYEEKVLISSIGKNATDALIFRRDLENTRDMLYG